MRQTLFTLITIFLVCNASCFKQWYEDFPGTDLTTENFFDYVGQNNYVFVKFYTTWCKYCRIMSPAYDKLYELIKETRKDIVIARLESDANSEVTDSYDIHSFPKLVLFGPNNQQIFMYYEGERSVSEMINWLNRVAPPIVVEKPAQNLKTPDCNTANNQHEHEHPRQTTKPRQSVKPTNTQAPAPVPMPAPIAAPIAAPVQVQQQQQAQVNNANTEAFKEMQSELERLRTEVKSLQGKLEQTKAPVQAEPQRQLKAATKDVKEETNAKAKFAPAKPSTAITDSLMVMIIAVVVLAAIITAKKVFNKM